MISAAVYSEDYFKDVTLIVTLGLERNATTEALFRFHGENDFN